jgi:hypothetical protein
MDQRVELAGRAGEREPVRGEGGWTLDGGGHGAARAGEGVSERLRSGLKPRVGPARCPERGCAEEGEGSDCNPRKGASPRR